MLNNFLNELHARLPPLKLYTMMLVMSKHHGTASANNPARENEKERGGTRRARRIRAARSAVLGSWTSESFYRATPGACQGTDVRRAGRGPRWPRFRDPRCQCSGHWMDQGPPSGVEPYPAVFEARTWAAGSWLQLAVPGGVAGEARNAEC